MYHHARLIPLLTLWAMLISALNPVETRAQARSRVNPSIVIGIPVSEFADNVDNAGVGLELTGGIGLPPAPVMFGANLGFMIYGFERRSEPLSTTIPDVVVDVNTTNNIAYGHLLFRIQPQSGAIQPYLDALFGFKYLFTRTSIENRRTNEEFAASTNFDDFASSYGFGGGLDIRISPAARGSLLINIGARYLLGGNAEYLKKGSIRRENGQVTYDITRSRTDLVMPQIGVTFVF